MSGGQRLSEQHFVKFENDLDVASGHLATNVKNLVLALEAVQVGWKGDAAGQFDQAQRTLNEGHEDVRQLVEKIKAAVQLTRRAGGANDHELATTFRNTDVETGALKSKLDDYT
ncbi:WXG100 family type VII secretion target [Streptomyces sp. NPDC021098]|uniref:WXG100 family type VII secretion target n=1 Tax=unclassified Streptomyces TaxID=2593676 RepID=UPI0037B7C224